MKRAYSKPEIAFEDFSLSTNIASCNTPGNQAENVCGYFWPGIGYVFSEDISGCQKKVDNGDWNGICYHVPTGDKNLFNS